MTRAPWETAPLSEAEAYEEYVDDVRSWNLKRGRSDPVMSFEEWQTWCVRQERGFKESQIENRLMDCER